MAWTTKPPIGTQLDFTNPINNGLVGCWIFNEGTGTLVNDLSGNNNTGLFTNIVSPYGWTIGDDGQSVVSLDGVNDYIDMGNPASLNFGTGNYTFMSDVKIISYVNTGGIIGHGAVNDSRGGYSIRTLSSPQSVEVIIGNGTLRKSILIPSTNLPTNQFHKIVGVVDRTNNILYVYLDGNLYSSISIIDLVGSTSSFDYNFTIGSHYNFANIVVNMTGVWNRILTPSEISTLNTNLYSIFLDSTSCPPLTCTLNIT